MKHNTAALVLAILGTICGVIGGLMWATCADACAGVVGTSGGYVAGFCILGIGGAALSLIGGIQAFGYKKSELGLSVIGFLMQVANFILQCVFLGGFSFTLSVWTILAIVLLLLETIMSAKKPQ